MADVPTLDKFAEVLKAEESWYDLGVMLGASVGELNTIQNIHEKRGVITCLVQLHDCLEKKGKDLSWKTIATALDRMSNQQLADKIRSEYIWPPLDRRQKPIHDDEQRQPVGEELRVPQLMVPNNHRVIGTSLHSQHSACSTDSAEIDVNSNGGRSGAASTLVAVTISREITKSYLTLVESLATLLLKIKEAFERSEQIDVGKIQDLSEDLCGLPPLPSDQATFNTVFNRLKKLSSILNFRFIKFLVETLLSNSDELVHELQVLEADVEKFKSSIHMHELITTVKTIPIATDEQKIIKLKVREFWSNFTLKQFEVVVIELFQTLHDLMFDMTVTKGCICVTWWIPSTHTSKFITLTSSLSPAFLKAIGVISLHVGNKPIHYFEGPGCETIEAAMVQAVELRNTQAIELFLSIGCDPVMSTYSDQYTVTNIVNITDREEGLTASSNGGNVQHVCVLGHNQHVTAIVDSTDYQCTTCKVNELVTKQLHQEIDTLNYQIKNQKVQHEQLVDTLQVSVKDKELEIVEKADEVCLLHSRLLDKENELQRIAQDGERSKKLKDAEIVLLKKSSELLVIENQSKEKEIMELRNEIAKLRMTETSPYTAVLPHDRRLGIGAVMKVTITRGGAIRRFTDVEATLSCNINKECPVTDNNDGTYTVEVMPQQLGRHQLSIAVNGQYIQSSPFTLDIVPQRDYTSDMTKPVQTISGVKLPMYMGFSSDGGLYVSSSSDHCIHVYDKTGQSKKTTIGDEGSFLSPRGIDICGGVIYIAEHDGHRIQQVSSLNGERIGTFGKKGSKVGQFNCPSDVKVYRDGKVYVADTHNDRVQVFNPDWSVSHVIDGVSSGFARPMAIAFDPLGNVHVTGIASSSIMVFTASGQFVRQYNHKVRSPTGIAIDPSGNSLVNDLYDGSLSVFDPQGTLIYSMGDFNNPYGVAVSPIDDSVWIADWLNDKIVKY